MIPRVLFAAFCLMPLARAQDPDAVLRQARDNLVRITGNLPRYTCTETVDRDYFAAPQAPGRILVRPAPESCPALFEEPTGKPTFTDRLRLEVTVADGREIHAWPGASEFDLRPIDEIVDGPISTGAFGNYLLEVFTNPGTNFTFIARKNVNRRAVFEYAYRTQLPASHYRVGKARRLIAHGGSFQIDSASFEIVRLTIHTDPIPVEIGMCRDHDTTEFHMVPIGDGLLILPLESVMQILEPGGSVSRTTTTFSACHEYRAESTIRFDDDSASTAAPKPTQARRVPAAVSFTLRSTAPIDFNQSAAGDPFSARVIHSSDKRAIPEGATVSGRLSIVRHYVAMNRYQLAFTVETLTVKNVSTRLAAIPARPRTPAELPQGFRTRGVELAIPPPGSGIKDASFVFPGRTSIVKPGFESLWITVN